MERKWEYRIEDKQLILGENAEDKLSSFGKEGWELVAISDCKAIFKREKSDTDLLFDTSEMDGEETCLTCKMFDMELVRDVSDGEKIATGMCREWGYMTNSKNTCDKWKELEE